MTSPGSAPGAAHERLQRMIDAGFVPPKPGEWDAERFNRIIAGEE
jgi:hypothetical protein